MQLSFLNQVKSARNIVQLADCANSLQVTTLDLIDPAKKKIHDARLDVLRARIDQLTTGDTISVGKFAVNCNFPVLRHFAVRAHMRKFGIQSLDDIEIFLQVLAKEPYPENQIAQRLLYDIFDSAENAFIVPKLSFELKSAIEILGVIVLRLAQVRFDRFDSLPTLEIFTSSVVDAIVQKIFDGETPNYFLDATRVAAHCCDLVVTITQREDVTTDILLDVLQAPIFLDDRCRRSVEEAPYIRATYDIFLSKFITLFEQKRIPLSYDHLRIIARNIVDEKKGGRNVKERENFVIRRVLPLIIMGNDPVHFANAFFARTSAHRFISAYLHVCCDLSEDHLKGLAECVCTGDPTGDDAAAQLFTVQRKFGLNVDIDQILEDVRNPKISGIAIIMGGPEGMSGAMSLDEFKARMEELLRNRQNPD